MLDVAEQMERAAFPDDASSDGIHFDWPRGLEWLNDVFQRHISALEADLLETAQFTFGPPPNPPFLASKTLSSRLGTRVDSRDSSRSRDFSRARMMETADLTAIPIRSVMGPINYRPLKLLGGPGLIVEPPKHRSIIARIRLATPAQLRVVDKLLDPREMELPDAAYEGTRLADDPRYGKPCGNAQLAKTLAVYDKADPAAARVIIVAISDFEGTSPKLFWQETLIYSLPGVELNQMLTLKVAIKSEMPCKPELLLFAGMNDHLHVTGFEQLKGDEPAPKKIWEAIQTLFAAMNEVQENVTSRFGSKTRVVFTTSPRSAVCICGFDLNSRGECMADPDGSSQSRVGTDELEASQVRTGGDVGGCVPRVEGFL